MTVREFVPPVWGTRRRTREEWLDAGGDPKLAPPSSPWWPTLGTGVGKVARRMLLPPMPHQQYVFDVAFERDPHPERPGDLLWYSEVNVWLMRQCGKTMGIVVPALVHRCTVMPRKLGSRQRVAFTMQDRQETRKKFEMDIVPQLEAASDSFRRIVNPKGRPGRSTAEWKSSLNNGHEHIQFGKGNYFLIETPSAKAGHGSTIDAKGADEVRFGVDDRVEAASGPAQITRPSSQLLVASTAGDERSFYMWPKVVSGRARVERDDHETRVCSFEWTIPPDADLHDPETWLEFHPAAGRTVPVRDLIAEVRKAEDHPDETKIDTVRQEHGNQWIRHPATTVQEREPTIPGPVWTDRGVAAVEPSGPCVLGVAIADDGRSGAIVAAWWIGEGVAVVRLLDNRPGTFWIGDELAEHVRRLDVVAVSFDAGGPTNALEGPIGRAAGNVDVQKISGRAYASACKAFVTGFVEGRYRHQRQAALSSALDGTWPKMRAGSWVWDLQTTSADASPLVAATVALRVLEGQPQPRRSAYDEDDLILV